MAAHFLSAVSSDIWGTPSRPPLPPVVDDSCAEVRPAAGNGPGYVRWDGRGCLELRSFSLRCGSIQSAAGSAYYAMGNTKVNCAVSGPRHAPSSRINSVEVGSISVELVVMPFARADMYRRKQGAASSGQMSDKTMVTLVEEAVASVVCLSRYPQSLIEITATVIEDDGCLLEALTNCVITALADAEIVMEDLIAAVCVTTIPTPPTKSGAEGYVTIVDPDRFEEQHYLDCSPVAATIFHVGLCPSHRTAPLLHVRGLQIPEVWDSAIKVAREASEFIGTQMRLCLARRGHEKLQTSTITT
eukprot:Selendium_serpulae@DN4168_c0_g1_i1.p2